jgi:hypothetical protein
MSEFELDSYRPSVTTVCMKLKSNFISFFIVSLYEHFLHCLNYQSD